MRVTRRGDEGNTLMELTVVMMLLGIVSAIVSTTMIGAMRSTRQQQNRSYAVAGIQDQLERISRDLRVADPVRAASANSITVDLLKGSTCLRRTWALSGTSLVVTTVTYAAWASCSVFPATVTATSTSTVTALQQVGNGGTPLFTYADGIGNALASPTVTQIGNVAVTLVQTVPEKRVAPSFTTSVGVKNATIR